MKSLEKALKFSVLGVLRSLIFKCLRCDRPARLLLGKHGGLVEPRECDDGGREATRLAVHLHGDHFRGDDLRRLTLSDAGAVTSRL